jgi:hypothetical protein
MKAWEVGLHITEIPEAIPLRGRGRSAAVYVGTPRTEYWRSQIRPRILRPQSAGRCRPERPIVVIAGYDRPPAGFFVQVQDPFPELAASWRRWH